MKKTVFLLICILLFVFSISSFATDLTPYERMVKIDFEVTANNYQYSLKVTNNTDYDITAFEILDYQLTGDTVKGGTTLQCRYPISGENTVIVPAHNSAVFTPIKVLWNDCDNIVSLIYCIDFADGVRWGISMDTYNSIATYAKEVRTSFTSTPLTQVTQQGNINQETTEDTVFGGIFFLIIIFLVIIYVKRKKKKRNSKIKNTDNVSRPKEIVKDAGSIGEFLAFDKLNSLPGNKRLLHNIYLKKPDGTTTEIDVLLIHEKGLFVLESKNYSGHIWGNVTDKQWTQVLRKTSHNVFYNPVLQNKGHIKNLKSVLSYSLQDAYRDIPIYSIIVFSDKTDTAKINTDGLEANIKLIKQSEISTTITDIISHSECPPYPIEDLNKIYSALVPLTTVSEEEKQKHINNIQTYH